MKKIILLSLCAINFALGQSLTITPNGNPTNLVKTLTNQYGFEHTDGTIRVNTYVNNSSPTYLGGWLQTYTNHPLILSTYNGTPQLYLNNNGNIILNPSDGKSGSVGIGLLKTASPSEKLEVNGNIRSSNLAGTGIRNVKADANGTLTTAPKTYTISISPQAFQPRYNNSGTFVSGGGYSNCFLSVGSTDDLVAPVTFPDGATITGVTLYYIDADATTKFGCQLNRCLLAGTTSYSIYYGKTSVISPSNSSVLSTNIPINPSEDYSLVDNSTYQYYILISTIISTGGSLPWADNMSIKGLKITYTL